MTNTCALPSPRRDNGGEIHAGFWIIGPAGSRSLASDPCVRNLDDRGISLSPSPQTDRDSAVKRIVRDFTLQLQKLGTHLAPQFLQHVKPRFGASFDLNIIPSKLLDRRANPANFGNSAEIPTTLVR
jgi:hypothetical protein